MQIGYGAYKPTNASLGYREWGAKEMGRGGYFLVLDTSFTSVMRMVLSTALHMS